MKNKTNLSPIIKAIRRNIVTMAYKSQGSHVGCSLDIVDMLTVLYFSVLAIDPKKPLNESRDRFILSKGHASSALYATLAERGFFPRKELDNYYQDGSHMAAHTTYQSYPGIEATAGSLGHGLPMGVGMALALKNMKNSANVYVMVGDGECLEGSIWEAIIFAGYHKLSNLVLIIDNNDMITFGKMSSILGLGSIDEKLRVFDWKTKTIDGHNVYEIEKALKTEHSNTPLAIIAKTTKGKGVSFMENNHIWHGKAPNEGEYKQALKELS